jgi:hypothetical protein
MRGTIINTLTPLLEIDGKRYAKPRSSLRSTR